MSEGARPCAPTSYGTDVGAHGGAPGSEGARPCAPTPYGTDMGRTAVPGSFGTRVGAHGRAPSEPPTERSTEVRQKPS